MSFVKTLATLAVGFAAAKGIQKVQEMGGVGALKDQMRKAGAQGGAADQLGQMAEKMGIPGAAEMSRKLAATMGSGAADSTTMGQSGLEWLMGVFAGLAATGTDAVENMVKTLPGGEAVTAQSEESAKLMIRAMIQAAKSDGTIDAAERQKILDHLGDATPEEIAFVEAQLQAPVDPVALAADTAASIRAQVYGAAVMAITVDTPAESDFLARLAAALGIDDATRDMMNGAARG